MIQTPGKKKVATAPTVTTSNESATHDDSFVNTLPRSIRFLEMTPAMSAARVLNTTIPIDFEHVRAEETLRQDMMTHLRAWSIATLHHRIHTQSDAIRFRHAYTGTYREVA